jgi:hypothetical protein
VHAISGIWEIFVKSKHQSLTGSMVYVEWKFLNTSLWSMNWSTYYCWEWDNNLCHKHNGSNYVMKPTKKLVVMINKMISTTTIIFLVEQICRETSYNVIMQCSIHCNLWNNTRTTWSYWNICVQIYLKIATSIGCANKGIVWRLFSHFPGCKLMTWDQAKTVLVHCFLPGCVVASESLLLSGCCHMRWLLSFARHWSLWTGRSHSFFAIFMCFDMCILDISTRFCHYAVVERSDAIYSYCFIFKLQNKYIHYSPIIFHQKVYLS